LERKETKKVELKAAKSPEEKVADPPAEDPFYDETFGCGMSGGGIRSAAFCSGALWALMNQSMLPPKHLKDNAIALPRGKIPKFYSCVSGGGYIGASFLWWARCMGGVDPRLWQDAYFSRMKRKVGYYIDCSNPMRALVDVCRILFFITFLLFAGVASFLPSTYILSEMIILPYDGYYNILRDAGVLVNYSIPFDSSNIEAEALLGQTLPGSYFFFLSWELPYFTL